MLFSSVFFILAAAIADILVGSLPPALDMPDFYLSLSKTFSTVTLISFVVVNLCSYRLSERTFFSKIFICSLKTLIEVRAYSTFLIYFSNSSLVTVTSKRRCMSSIASFLALAPIFRLFSLFNRFCFGASLRSPLSLLSAPKSKVPTLPFPVVSELGSLFGEAIASRSIDPPSELYP